MPVNLYLRSMGILSVLFGLVFGLSIIVAFAFEFFAGVPYELWWTVFLFAGGITVLFAFLQFLISPWIMDFTLAWIYHLDWYHVDQLDPQISSWIRTLEGEYPFNFKRVGIIRDFNPNAFTYGHFRKNARLVLSEGIFQYLNLDEQKAVIAHEAGHVVHRDFIFMTMASVIPVIAYTIFAGLRYSGWVASMRRSGRGRNQANAAVALLAIAAAAYVVYFISQYLVLFLSRVREYYADAFAGRACEDPGHLSSALVKIAYGMINVEAQNVAQSTRGRDQAPRSSFKTGFQTGIRSMGIFDKRAARHLSLSMAGQGQMSLETVSDVEVAAAFSWDLSNPWAGFLELHSTHPLPAKRVRALNEVAAHSGMAPAFPSLGRVKPPESLWDEFIIDLFHHYISPSLWIILPLILGIATTLLASPLLGIGLGMVLFSFIWWLRKREKYPKINLNRIQRSTIVGALTDMTKNSFYEASPTRGKPILIEGKIVGKGIPGYWLSEDVMVQDESGLVKIDYQSLIGFMNWLFAIFRVNELIGQNARVVGWYHRAPYPYIQLWKLETESGRTVTNHWHTLNTFIVLLFAGLGLFTTIVGIAMSVMFLPSLLALLFP